MLRRRLGVVLFVAVMAGVGALGILSEVRAGGKPPCKTCKERVGPCVLISCGEFDCVYQCPFPTP